MSVYLNTTKYTFNPTYYHNISLTVFNNSERISCVNATADLKVDLVKIILDTCLKIKTDGEKEYNQVLYQGNVDLCQASKGIFANFIIRLVSDQLEQYSNYRFACPQKAQFMYATNFPVNIGKYIPTYFQHLYGFWELTCLAKGKSFTSKKFARLFSVKLYGNSVSN